ncbi:MAG: galactose-1-phosphate uridylyltransferase [Pseudomonadota bacterium]
MGFHIYKHDKRDGRKLWLYSQAERDYQFTNDMPPVDSPSKPIARHHPLRGEQVFYNPGRNTRTLNPPPDYNPLAPVPKDGFPGEIPVTDFEVAIFQNRWPGLTDPPDMAKEFGHAYGRCEVVVYDTADTGSLADRSVEEVALLLRAIGHRYEDIMADPAINVVLPFENRGAFVGTTLPHPHGQIYAFRDLSPMMERQAKAASDGAFSEIDRTNAVASDALTSTFCPSFGRYPYETWIMPERSVTSPSEMSEAELTSFAVHLRDQVARFDQLFSTPMPYVMWHALPPRGSEAVWPYHIQFWPLQRGEGKMKYLASVEQITGSYLVDVMPEDAAQTLAAMKI